jgi:hypothetical protein
MKNLLPFLFAAALAAFGPFPLAAEPPPPDGEEGLALRGERGAGLRAAYASAPPGTAIRVINLENSRTLEITVEGPPGDAAESLLVLSPEAADTLGIEINAWVRVESVSEAGGGNQSSGTGPARSGIVLEPAEPRVPPAPVRAAPAPEQTSRPLPVSGGTVRVIPSLPSPSGSARYLLQAGAFLVRYTAERLRSRIERAGFSAILEEHGVYFRVVIPGIPAPDIAETVNRLGALGVREVWVRR